MRVPSSLRTLLRDNRAVFLLVSLGLFVATVTYYVVLRGRELDSSVVNDQILLFFLRNVNAVLVITIAYVLIRNLFKLWVERKRRQLGSKFKTKLVATYIGLSLIPVLLLFAYATELVQGSLDNLFQGQPIEELLEPGFEVSQALSSEIQNRNMRDANRVLASITEIELDEPTERPSLSRILQRRLSELDLDLLAIYRDTEFILAILNPETGLSELPELTRSYLLEARREGQAAEVEELAGRPERWLLGAAASMPSESDVEAEPRTIVVAGKVLGPVLASHTEKLVNAAQNLQKLQVQEDDIRSIYLLLFLMVTLLILLISSWVGLYLARRITVPIEALAEGTRRITSGDLGHRVQEAADDELGVLVDSFNTMTGELQRNKELLEESNLDLTASNLRLDDERARIGAVLENLAAGVVSTDADGRVRTLNSAALQMLGLRADDLVGRGLLEAPVAAEGGSGPDPGPGQEALASLFGPALESERATHKQMRVTLAGEWKTFEVKSTPLVDDAGQLTGRVLVLEDLTELIKAQKLATWNEAARRIAHEIKNPLTPIRLSAERVLRKHLEQDPNLGPALEKAMHIIVREVGNMKTMVDEFARFARMPRPQPSDVELVKLLEETVALYDGIKPGLLVSSRIDDSFDGRASLDSEQLRNALVNLLDNAVDATEAPGKIEVQAARRNGSLQIRVSDTGTGIPGDAKEKLFLPYYSTKGRGTGLGLAIVHRIVTDHHGTIRVEDNRPCGTTFTIDLPQ